MRIFLISLIVFVGTVFASYTLQNNKVSSSMPTQVLGAVQNEELLNIIPVLSITSSYPTFSAASVYAYDLDSGISLYEKNSDLQLLPASTTKIITALVALDYYSLDQEIIVSVSNIDGQKMGLVPGEKIKILDLLYGLLVWSANDAAEQLAMMYPGGKENFVLAMNQKASSIGMRDTHFQNPQGFENPEHFSTAQDMAVAAEFAINSSVFRKIVSTKEYTAESTDYVYKHKMVNLNELLGVVPGVVGIKTGWTENAKENLVTLVERDNHEVVVVILGSDDRFGETEELINWIFDSYAWRAAGDAYLNKIGKSSN